MRIDYSIEVKNFLGIKHVSAHVETPITLFCGANGAGKSSIRDAIAFALTDDLGRVSLKKDATKLLNDATKPSEITVGDYEVAITDSGKIVSAKSGVENYPSLPFVINPHRFASLSENDRRKFLFELSGLSPSGSFIVERLQAKGHAQSRIDKIAPFLRSGFEAAQKEAEGIAREAKGAYKSTTGGETWGRDKGGRFGSDDYTQEEENSAIKAGKLAENAKKKIGELQGLIEVANQELGKAQLEKEQQELQCQNRNDLKNKAEKIDRIKAKLKIDQDRLEEWEKKVKLTKAMAEGETEEHDASECPCCGALLQVLKTDYGPIVFKEYVIDKRQADPEAIRRLPDEEKTLNMLKETVSNDERDLKIAQDAAEKLASSHEIEVPDIDEIKGNIQQLIQKSKNWQVDYDKYSEIAKNHAQREKVIKKALEHHADILAWIAIADDLSPEGIPGELLDNALSPINSRLLESSEVSEWGPVYISSDMSIIYKGIEYGLCSESEQWRADAMIAEAISHVSGLKILCLDRVDVLDPTKGRGDLFYWLNCLVDDGELDTVFLFATLKQSPTIEGVTSVWIENGFHVKGDK